MSDIESLQNFLWKLKFERHMPFFMALYPRQNSTFAFDVQFTFNLCCPRFDMRVWQSNIEVLVLHNATLFLYVTIPLHVFNSNSVIRHAWCSFYASFPTRMNGYPSKGNPLHFCGLKPAFVISGKKSTCSRYQMEGERMRSARSTSSRVAEQLMSIASDGG